MNSFENVPVFILCGGLGTRIKEETELKPKPMVPIGSHPILWHIMHLYRRHGFKKFVLCTGFKSEVVKDYFLHYTSRHSDFTVDLSSHSVNYHSMHHQEDWEVTVAYTGELTMTGGRLAIAAEKYLGDAEHAAVTYGDGLTDANLLQEFAFHKKHGKLGTVLGVNPPSRFGEICLDGDSVAQFSEKPDFHEKWINGGFFFFKREFFSTYLKKEESCVLEKTPLVKLAEDGELNLYKHPGFWACMDTQRDRDHLNQLWASGKAPWTMPSQYQNQGKNMKKVFVTGHKGYIGVHLVDVLKAAGYYVAGCDLDLFEGCEWEPFVKADKEFIQDFRQLKKEDLVGYDCIMHLAAISNDPMGDLDPEITYSINRDGTKRLAELAKEAGIPQFLFASSCSIYGKGESLDIDEEGQTSPLTAYASSKITAEEHLKTLTDEKFQAVCLRNATAYGFSPMLRIDLVVNNLLACGLSRGDIRVMSDGSPWRPLIHCRDIARAFAAFFATPPKDAFLIINVGGNSENYQVKDVVNTVKARLPEASVVFTGEVGADPRNYRVNFNKLAEVLPDFKLEYNLEKGVEELFEKYKVHGFELKDFEGDQFVRLRTLKKRLNKLN